jgi:hypothetical protein
MAHGSAVTGLKVTFCAPLESVGNSMPRTYLGCNIYPRPKHWLKWEAWIDADRARDEHSATGAVYAETLGGIKALIRENVR